MRCGACGLDQERAAFSQGQLQKRPTAERKCSACAEAASAAAGAGDATPRPAIKGPAETPAAGASFATAGGWAVSDLAQSSGSGTDDEPDHDCPICLVNADDYYLPTDGKMSPGMCFNCGQLYCGPCFGLLQQQARNGTDSGRLCPTCRAVLTPPGEENFARLNALVLSRSPGRHTAWAHYNLGCMHASGETWNDETGVLQDYSKAAEHYTHAAVHGHVLALQNLGNLHLEGDGVPVNKAEARRLYQAAADQGHPTSQMSLGQMFAHGDGCAKDPIKALGLYTLAAAQGLPQAKVHIGRMYV